MSRSVIGSVTLLGGTFFTVKFTSLSVHFVFTIKSRNTLMSLGKGGKKEGRKKGRE